MKLVEDGVASLVSLRDNDLGASRPISQDCLKGIQDWPVGRSPSLDDDQVLNAGATFANRIACAIYPPARAARKGG